LNVNEERGMLPDMSELMSVQEHEARDLLSKWEGEVRPLTCLLEAPAMSVRLLCVVHAITEHTVVLRHVTSDDEAAEMIEFQLTGADCSFMDFSDNIESGLQIHFPQWRLDVPQQVVRPHFRVLRRVHAGT
jgi:hypothetical protein